jgi:hypothetical protein
MLNAISYWVMAFAKRGSTSLQAAPTLSVSTRSRRSGRTPDDEAGRQRSRALRLLAPELRDEHPAGHEALLDVGLIDGREGRIRARSLGHVVEAHYGELLGYG